MNFACRYKGGSHAYGLETPQSDLDLRGVFLHTDMKHVLGLEKFEHWTDPDEEDAKYYEYRRAMQQLRKGNTEVVEALFNADFMELGDVWLETQKHKGSLVSSEQLFKCLCGYMQGEYRLAMGERTGKLGGKRKAALDKHGFSPKNFVQLFRLAWAGDTFFQKGYFPVSLVGDPLFHTQMLNLKTKPEMFNKAQLKDMFEAADARLKVSFDNRVYDYEYDDDLANDLVLKAYGPLVKEAYINLM